MSRERPSSNRKCASLISRYAKACTDADNDCIFSTSFIDHCTSFAQGNMSPSASGCASVSVIVSTSTSMRMRTRVRTKASTVVVKRKSCLPSLNVCGFRFFYAVQHIGFSRLNSVFLLLSDHCHHSTTLLLQQYDLAIRLGSSGHFLPLHRPAHLRYLLRIVLAFVRVIFSFAEAPLARWYGFMFSCMLEATQTGSSPQ